LSAFEATGIWPLNPRKILDRQSHTVTRQTDQSGTTVQFSTPRHSRGVSRLQRDALHLVTRDTPSSRQLKTLIERLGRSAAGALAEKDLGEEMLRDLRSQAKDVSVAATKDRRHLTKARVITHADVVALREERLRLDRQKEERAKKRQQKAAVKAATSAASSSGATKATVKRSQRTQVVELSDGEGQEEEEEWLSESDEDEDFSDEEDQLVDLKGSDDTTKRGKGRQKARKEVTVVTRSGRVVRPAR
jgi:hypothetical protein